MSLSQCLLFWGAKAVAVKRYRHQPGMLSNPDDDRRALRTEALLLHGIRHPNIVSVRGLLSENGTVNGYVMEKLGVSLHKASKKGHWCRERIAKAFFFFSPHLRSSVLHPYSANRTYRHQGSEHLFQASLQLQRHL